MATRRLNPNQQRLDIFLYDDQFKALKEFCEQRKQSVTEVVRTMLDKKLRRGKRELLQ